MTPLRKKEQTQTELTSLLGLAAITPQDDPFASHLLHDKIQEVQTRLQEIEEAPVSVPETEILFGGGPVIVSEGIDTKFAAKILDSFQDMVTNEFAASHGLLRRAGRRKGESDTRLFLTALPRGSVGVQLAQPLVTDFVTAGNVAKAMEEVTILVEATAASDEKFEDALVHFHPRVFKPLVRFFDTMALANAECRMLTGMRDVRLQYEQIIAGTSRASATTMTEKDVEEKGKFGGVLVTSRRFEFLSTTGNVISGWLAETVSDEDAEQMASQTGHMSLVKMKETTILTRSGRKKPAYELIALTPLEGDHELAAPVE